MEALYKIMKKMGVIPVAPDLEGLHSRYFERKKSILFALCYDVRREVRLNVEVVEVFGKTLKAANARIGALCKNEIRRKMAVCERDRPGEDLENLVRQASVDDNEGLMDVMHRAIDMIDNAQSSFLVILYKKEEGDRSIGTISSVQGALSKEMKIIFVNLGESCGVDVESFIDQSDGNFIDLKGKEFSSCLSDIMEAIGPLS